MKRNFIFLMAMFFAIFQSFAIPPTTPASNLNILSIEGNALALNWVPGNGTRRIIIARKDEAVTAVPTNGTEYIANNSFGLGNEISTGQFVVYNGSSNLTNIFGLIPSTTYHFAVFEYNGSGFSTEYLTASFVNGSKSTLSAPTTPATNLTFSNVTGNSIKFNWTNGNGTSRLLVARAGSAVNVNPADLVSYSAIGFFGLGDEIGTGNFVVARGSNTSTTLSLQPNTTYHFALYEFNGNLGPVYQVSNPATGSQTTAARPSAGATNLTFNNAEGNNINVSLTPGNGARRIIIAKQGSAVTAVPVDGQTYTADDDFGSGAEIAPGEFVVYNGANNNVIVKSLQHSTTYHFAVFEYDGTLGTNTAYLTSSVLAGSRSTVTIPTTATTNLNFTNIASNSVTLNWTNGNGTRRLVVGKVGSPVDVTPEQYKQYAANFGFGGGSEIEEDNFVVYSGNGSSTNVVNLAFNATYHFSVFEFNGSSAPVYLTTTPATGSVTTSNTPTIASSALFYNVVEGNAIALQWQAGNGTRRIVVAKAGSAITGLPLNGTDYTASNTFGSGDEIAPGEYVVADGTNNSLLINNLTPGTVYHFAIFEYNGTGATTAYLTSTFLAGNRSTQAAPTVQASGITFSNITGNSATINWVNGNGTRRLLVGRAGSAVNSNPVDLNNYAASSVFGSGEQVGTGNYVVFAHNSNTASVLNLQPNTTYHFALYEYNGNTGPVYLTSSPATNSFTTLARPTSPATNFLISNADGSRLTLSFSAGNGTRRLIVGRKGSAVTAVPADGVNYNASATFGDGDAVAPDQFAVLNGTNTNFVVSNLEPGTTYHFTIFEYDGSNASIGYLTSAVTSASASTVSKPTVQTSNLFFTSTTNNTMLLNWTNGSGTQRLVIGRKSSPVNTMPVDFTSYPFSTTFGFGANLGDGNFVVYKGNSSSINITNLAAGTTYHFAIFEFNGNNTPVYNTTSPATGSNTTIGTPADQASDATLSIVNGSGLKLDWVNGSGQKRIVLAKEGSPVDAVPLNNTAYTPNSFFQSGQEIGNGNYVVFNGTGNSVTVSNLTEGANYHFAVFEYNDFGATKFYLTTNPARASQNIVLPITLTDFSLRATGRSVQLNWSTATEANTKEFVIERSFDGVRFSLVNTVKSAGNSNTLKRYNYTDDLTSVNLQAGKVYYRLKQVDADNKYTYSNVINTSIKAGTKFKIHGNIVSTNLSFTFDRLNHERFTLRLFDVNGRRLIQQQLQGSGVITADVSRLANGQYIAEVQCGEARYYEQFVKVK